MNILSKSAVCVGQLKARVEADPLVEIQLFSEFEEGKTVDEVFETITSIEGIDIICVHAPLPKDGDMNLEFVEGETCYAQIKKTIELADKFSRYYQHNVKVVIHSGFSVVQYHQFPMLMSRVYELFQPIVNTYKQVTICIEQIIPMVVRNGQITSRNGYFFDNVNFVKELREHFQCDRFCTVLDTCHMIVTLRTIEKVFGDEYPELIEKYNADLYFKMHKDVIGLIHLADVKGLGYHKMEHGVKFEGFRYHVMHDFINLYHKYGYTCDITIEIQETDYIACNNLKENYRELKEYLCELPKTKALVVSRSFF